MIVFLNLDDMIVMCVIIYICGLVIEWPCLTLLTNVLFAYLCRVLC